MESNIKLKCNCGKVEGIANNVSPSSGTHLICMCDDCKAYAKYLKRETDILDENCGTQIFQLTPSQVEITKGTEHIACLRLTPKGLMRWYTSCCNTPMGNSMGAKAPFIGMPTIFMDTQSNQNLQQNLGPIRAKMMGKKSKNGKSPNSSSFKILLFIIRSVFKMGQWWLKGMRCPHPFYLLNNEPIVAPNILTRVEREVLV